MSSLEELREETRGAKVDVDTFRIPPFKGVDAGVTTFPTPESDWMWIWGPIFLVISIGLMAAFSKPIN